MDTRKLDRIIVRVMLAWSLLALVLMAKGCFAQSEPFPKPKQWAAINLGLAIADYESSLAVQSRPQLLYPQFPAGPNNPYKHFCNEGNSWFGSYPSRARFYSEGLAIDAGMEAVGMLFKHKAGKFWRIPFGFVSYWHTSGIVKNLGC